MSENFYKVIVRQSGIEMQKLCQGKPEMEIIAEYYEQSGFDPENIYIQNWEKGVYKTEITWDDARASEISIGHVLGVFQDALDHFSDVGDFGEENGLSHKIINGDQLGMDFESGEKFIITVKKLS